MPRRRGSAPSPPPAGSGAGEPARVETEHQHADNGSPVKREKTERLRTHLLPVELPEALPQLHEGGLHAGVVGQRQQRVGVAYWGH